MKSKERCYNCGKILKPNEITREHIPARNLFEGYDEQYKVQRITVKACRKCNQEYSVRNRD